jgi:hypothetical protein
VYHPGHIPHFEKSARVIADYNEHIHKLICKPTRLGKTRKVKARLENEKSRHIRKKHKSRDERNCFQQKFSRSTRLDLICFIHLKILLVYSGSFPVNVRHPECQTRANILTPAAEDKPEVCANIVHHITLEPLGPTITCKIQNSWFDIHTTTIVRKIQNSSLVAKSNTVQKFVATKI